MFELFLNANPDAQGRVIAILAILCFAGFLVVAIRPPTVPARTSRLRLAVMASHTPAELRQAARVLAEAVPAYARQLSSQPPLGDEQRVFDALRDAA